MQRNTGYFPTESLEPSGNRLFSRSALNEGDLFRGSLGGSSLARLLGCLIEVIHPEQPRARLQFLEYLKAE